MAERTRVLQYGLGPIGSAIARYVSRKPSLQLVGGVDIDPAKIGKDLGEIIGLDKPLNIPVFGSLGEALSMADVDVVIHATSSYFDGFMDQILEILDAGLDIVSTAEELSFPWIANPEEAAKIDAAAKRAEKTVLGTGVNPGFLMDSLVLNITAICQRVDHIAVTRRMNASFRRGPFQAKIGTGMSVDAFNAKMAEGHMGHVGLPQSMGMVFDTLGRKMTRYESSVEPVVANESVKTDFFSVKPGQVRGLTQVARGYTKDGEFMSMTFIAALGELDDKDTIKVKGVPALDVTLHGTNGDIATVAIAGNAVRRVKEAAPGLVTMRDLPIVTN